MATDVTTSLYLRRSLGSNLVLSRVERGLISRTAAGNRAFIKCYCVSLMPNFFIKEYMEMGDSNKDGSMTLEEYKSRYKFRQSDSTRRNLYLNVLYAAKRLSPENA